MKRDRADSREGMVGSTYWLPRSLQRQIKIAAMDDGKAVAVVLREALKLWLRERARTRRVKR